MNSFQSANGLIINGKKVKDPGEEVEIKEGTEFSLGPTVYKWSFVPFVSTIEGVASEVGQVTVTESPTEKETKGVIVETLEELNQIPEDKIQFNVVHVVTNSNGREIRRVPVKIRDKIVWFECQDEGKVDSSHAEEPSSKKMRLEEDIVACDLAKEDVASPTKDKIDKLRIKFNEELSCTICNEVFIMVSD
jgi:pSer/pThr/pTyr-binding forkhead associated (FHA) protein